MKDRALFIVVALAVLALAGWQTTGGRLGSPLGGNLTDVSGTIASANTSQLLLAANPHRHCLIVQNPSTAAAQGIATAESLWINFGSVATTATGSFEIPTGTPFSMCNGFVGTQSVNIIATTQAHAFTAKYE